MQKKEIAQGMCYLFLSFKREKGANGEPLTPINPN